ncbi:unnamed protein product [Rhizophagus irregularis]|nr:unnamed protein product [Rhizophagus irregularis]
MNHLNKKKNLNERSGKGERKERKENEEERERKGKGKERMKNRRREVKGLCVVNAEAMLTPSYKNKNKKILWIILFFTMWPNNYRYYIDSTKNTTPDVVIDSVNSDTLYELAQICKDLNTLSIRGYCNIPNLFYLIDAQRNLKELNLYAEVDEKTGNCGKELSKALRNRTTINSLYLDSIDNIVLSSLTTLVNLKKLSILHWKNYKEIQQYLAIYEFPNLQQLILRHGHLSSFKEISLLIEKTMGNISEIDIVTINKTAKEAEILIKAIVDNCPKISDLYTYIEPKDFIHVKTLLLNCRFLRTIELRSLEFFINENDNNIGDELLDIFILFSPKSLDNIHISGFWKYSIDAFNRFFEGFRKRPLQYFEIIFDKLSYNNITSDHKIIIRKYINEGVVKYYSC